MGAHNLSLAILIDAATAFVFDNASHQIITLTWAADMLAICVEVNAAI